MAADTTKPVLVLGESNRATLAVVRSLGRRGIPVHLGCAQMSSVAASRYVKKVIMLPSQSSHKSAWIEAIARASREYGYALIIPTTEGTAVPLILERSKIESIAKCAIPATEQFQRTSDKRQTVLLAKELGVPLPKTVIVEHESDLRAALLQFTAPFVIKPAFSRIWQDDTEIGLGVKIANTAQEATEMGASLLAHAPVLIQDHVEGVGVGQEFLCRDGEIIYAFQHDRLREYKGSGGSTYRVSAPLHAGMLEASRKLLKALQWNGVVMVEYRFDASTDIFALIEINGRFWGSLPLPVSLGIDFPYGLYQECIGEIAMKSAGYPAGIYARSMFEDVGQMRRSGASFVDLISEYALALTWLFSGKEHWDQFSLDDPMPFINVCRGFVAKAVQSLSRWLSFSQFKYLIPPLRSIARHALFRDFKNARSVLFLCYGNINRSAFAEGYFRQKDKIRTVRSAGEHKKTGRSASVEAKQAADKWGITLESHLSSVLNKELVKEADVIFVMDTMNMKFLESNFPEALTKAYFFGLISESGPLSISDPYSHSSDMFDRTFTRIALLIDRLEAGLAH
jgi:predicted ATP-grasp superfamily ATP-dependent carboligase/protein-tyrosine-phosphatase